MDADDPWSGILSAVAVRSIFHTTLQATPGQLVFGRDIIYLILNMWQTGSLLRTENKD